VRVPKVGEEPRYTLEQVRAGLLSDEVADTGDANLMARSEVNPERLVPDFRSGLVAALDHFSQQPAGVGADVPNRQSAGPERDLSPRSAVSVDSGGECIVPDCDCPRYHPFAPQGVVANDGRGQSLPPFDDTEKDGNQQPQGGDADAAREGPSLGRRAVAEGGSVQCGGVALAQLREQALEMREVVGRAAFFDHYPDLPEHHWDELTESVRGTWEGNAMAAVEAVFDALTQQSSGGQEGGVAEGAES